MHALSPRRPRFTPTTAIALLALFVALGGTAVAAGDLITGKQVKNSSLTGRDVRNGSLTGGDVKSSSLTGGDVKSESLTPADVDGLATVKRAHNDAAPDDGQDDAGPTLYAGAGVALRADCRREGDDTTARVTLVWDPGVAYRYEAFGSSTSSGGFGTGPGTTSFFSDSGPDAGQGSFHFFVTTSAGDLVSGEALLVVNGPAGQCEYLLNITG